MSDHDNTSAILEAIQKLDTKFDAKFAELKNADSTLTEEVQRIGRRQERMDQDLRDLKSETDRKLDAAQHQTKSTMDAAMKHFDSAARSFNDKATKIDTLNEKQDAQTKDIVDLKTTQAEQLGILRNLESGAAKVVSNPYVRILLYAIAAYVATHLNVKLPVPQ